LQTIFLGLDDDFEVHCVFCRFVSGSYWNIHDSYPVTMLSRKLVLSWQAWTKPWRDASLRCFCSSASLCGTDFAQIFPLRKSSWRIWRIVSLLAFSLSGIISRVSRRTHITISRTFVITTSRTFAVVSAFLQDEGCPPLGSSWRSSLPCLNRLSHSNTYTSVT
jgi:hypothetical protein